MVISNFNLRRSQVRKMGKISLNQSLVYTPLSPTLTQFFICPSSAQQPHKKLLLGRKKIGGAFTPPLSYACCVSFLPDDDLLDLSM
jgi:hypothetical protein